MLFSPPDVHALHSWQRSPVFRCRKGTAKRPFPANETGIMQELQGGQSRGRGQVAQSSSAPRNRGSLSGFLPHRWPRADPPSERAQRPLSRTRTGCSSGAPGVPTLLATAAALPPRPGPRSRPSAPFPESNAPASQPMGRQKQKPVTNELLGRLGGWPITVPRTRKWLPDSESCWETGLPTWAVCVQLGVSGVLCRVGVIP